MPYYVFKIHPPRRLELIEAFDAYRDARQHARAARRAAGGDATYQVRMVHAADPQAAQRLLHEQREPRPLGEDA